MSLTPGESSPAREPDSQNPGLDAAAIEVFDPEDVLGIGLGADILIVDDDNGNLVAYEAALSPLGRRVVLARSGMEALAQLLEQDFALILLDLTMPGMTGLETARLIRQRPRCKGTPIIFITGVAATSAVVLEAYDAGAFDFVMKPVLPEILRAKTGVYLRLQERTQHLLRQTTRLRTAHRQLERAEHKVREHAAAGAPARRLEKIQEATAALAEARTPAEVSAVAVRLGAEAIAASAATMWFAQSDGSLLVGASHGIPEAYRASFRHIPAGAPLPAIELLVDPRPIWIEHTADYAHEAPTQFERAKAAGRVWASATLPLVNSGKVIAVLSYTYEGDHTFSHEERAFLLALVRTCEQALERARLYVAEADARQAAELLNHRKDEFLAMLGHELRNPLSVMTSSLELMKQRAEAPSRELSVLDRQVAHLTHLVGDLVVVSRITQGKIELVRSTVDLGQAVATTLDSLRALLDDHEHEVVATMPDGLLVDADRHRLHQVLSNLLTNAATYTPNRGRIEISAALVDRHVRIVVRDNGRGIPAQLLPDVFELFVQGDRSPDRQEGGLGIGLTLAKTIVELHGGSVAVHSEGAGMGSTFVVRWPIAVTNIAVEPIPLPRLASVAPLRVLVVDDNADAAELLAELMGLSGHHVTVANEATSALELAKDFGPEVALLDIGLPIIDGYELARRLRLLPACADILLIAISGYGQPDDRERSKRAGFAHHLVKPVDTTVLRTLLADLAVKPTS